VGHAAAAGYRNAWRRDKTSAVGDISTAASTNPRRVDAVGLTRRQQRVRRSTDERRASSAARHLSTIDAACGLQWRDRDRHRS